MSHSAWDPPGESGRLGRVETGPNLTRLVGKHGQFLRRRPVRPATSSKLRWPRPSTERAKDGHSRKFRWDFSVRAGFVQTCATCSFEMGPAGYAGREPSRVNDTPQVTCGPPPLHVKTRVSCMSRMSRVGFAHPGARRADRRNARPRKRLVCVWPEYHYCCPSKRSGRFTA
jgi:hypothetical protein